MEREKKNDVLYNMVGEIALFWVKFDYNGRKKEFNYRYIGQSGASCPPFSDTKTQYCTFFNMCRTLRINLCGDIPSARCDAHER